MPNFFCTSKLTFTLELGREGDFVLACDEIPDFISEGGTVEECLERWKDFFETFDVVFFQKLI